MKKKIWNAILEAVGELILTLLCLGIGILIVSLFGVNVALDDVDYDLLILLGCAVFVASFIAVYFFVQWIKKRFEKRKNEE
ncbi:MAG: hypothetical protein IJY39_12105 [Clostridia bacterium]|nr:hypothetical protein [Clostridia bacterium]